MLVAVQFDKSNEQTVNDHFDSLRPPDFKLFCCGSKEVIAESLKENCHNCQKSITSEDANDNEKIWIVFILNKKNDELLLNLLDICSIKVEKFQDISKFFGSVKIHCRICLRRASRKRSLSIESSDSVVEIKPETVDKALETNNANNLDSRVGSAGPTSLLENQTIAIEATGNKPPFQSLLNDAPLVSIPTVETLVKTEMNNQMFGESHLANNSSSPVTKRARMEVLGSKAVKTETNDEVTLSTTHDAELVNTEDPPHRNVLVTNVVNNLVSPTFKRSRIEVTEPDTVKQEVKEENEKTVDNQKSSRPCDTGEPTDNQPSRNIDTANVKNKCDQVSTQNDFNDSNIGERVAMDFLNETSKSFERESSVGFNTHSELNETESELAGTSDMKKNAVNQTNSSVKKVDFECLVCRRKFVKRHSLTMHLITHPREKTFDCNLCGTKRASNQALENHKWIHHAIKSVPCDVCGIPFGTSSAMRTHKKTHLGKSEKIGKPMKYIKKIIIRTK